MSAEGASGKLQGGKARETMTSRVESRKNCPQNALLRWLARARGCGLLWTLFFPFFFFRSLFFTFFSVGGCMHAPPPLAATQTATDASPVIFVIVSFTLLATHAAPCSVQPTIIRVSEPLRYGIIVRVGLRWGNNNVNERTEVFPPGVKQLGK